MAVAVRTPPGLESSANSSTSTLHELRDPAITPALQAELARDQQRVTSYGGDDPEEPTPVAAKFVTAPVVSAVVQPKVDPDMVQWDGPDDPENPLNWSRGRRWLVTAVVILLSVNVYVT
jgi:DHA1 family multidrug resistance protein-like MFS transporter